MRSQLREARDSTNRALTQWKHACTRYFGRGTKRRRKPSVDVEWPLHKDAALEVVDFEEQRIVSLALRESHETEMPHSVALAAPRDGFDESATTSRLPIPHTWRRGGLMIVAAVSIVLVMVAAFTGSGGQDSRNDAVAASLDAVATSGRALPGNSSLKPVGRVLVSGPAGSRVWIDDTFRGNTPLELTDVSHGQHTLEIRGPYGSVRQQLTVEPHTTVSVLVPSGSLSSPSVATPMRNIRAREAAVAPAKRGWVSVRLPIPVRIFDGDVLLGTNDVNRLPIRAGSHQLRVVNDSLKFQFVKNVTVAPGESLTVTTTLPVSALSVNALPGRT